MEGCFLWEKFNVTLNFTASYKTTAVEALVWMGRYSPDLYTNCIPLAVEALVWEVGTARLVVRVLKFSCRGLRFGR